MKTNNPTWVRSAPGAILLGGVIGLTITFLGSVIIAWLINGERLGEENLQYGVIAVLLIASFVSAILATILFRGKRMLISLATGFVYFLILLAVNALLFGGQYQGVPYTLLVILAGCVCNALLGVREGGRPNNRRQRMLNR